MKAIAGEACRNLYAFVRMRLGAQLSDREIARRWGMEWKSFSAFKHGKRQVPRVGELEALADVIGVDPALVFEVARGVPAERIHGLLQQGDQQALAAQTLVGLRAAHQTAEAQRQQFNALCSRLSDAVFTMDIQGRFHDVNPPFCDKTGYPASVLSEMTLFDLLPPAERPLLVERAAAVYRDGAVEGAAFTLHTRAGVPLRFECGLARIVDGEGRPIGIQCLGRDVTERHRLERELAQQVSTLRSTFEAVPAACLLFGADGAILLANSRVEQVLRWNADELLGRKASEFFGSPGPRACPVTRAFMTGKPEQQLSRLVNRAGEEVFVHRTAGPVLGIRGEVERVVEILVDVSEQVRRGRPELVRLWGEQLFSSAARRASKREEGEKRKVARVPLELEVAFAAGRKRGLAVTRNLSAAGLFLQTDAALSPGTEVSLRWTLPEVGQRLKARGVVVWRGRGPSGGPEGVGIRFAAMAATEGRVLRRYLSQLTRRAEAAALRPGPQGPAAGRPAGRRRRRRPAAG